MTITYQTETVDVLDEAADLFRAHSLEVEPEHPADDLDLQMYRMCFKAGVARFVTARDAGRIVGYCTAVVRPVPNNRSTMEAVDMGYYVRPEYRGRMVGAKLWRVLADLLRGEGIAKVSAQAPCGRHDTSALFRYLGFHQSATVYTLRL